MSGARSAVLSPLAAETKQGEENETGFGELSELTSHVPSLNEPTIDPETHPLVPVQLTQNSSWCPLAD